MAVRSEIESLNFNELKEFLSTKLNNEVSQESLNNLETNRVSGKTFFQLDDGELSQLFPLIGERKAVKRLIDEYTIALALVPVVSKVIVVIDNGQVLGLVISDSMC